jgi:hypothetical protein
MEEMGMSLNLEEFIDATKRLYKSVSLPEKNVLVKRRRSSSARKSVDTDHETFQPNINSRSRRIASRHGSNDVGDRLYNKHYEYEMKKE